MSRHEIQWVVAFLFFFWNFPGYAGGGVAVVRLSSFGTKLKFKLSCNFTLLDID